MPRPAVIAFDVNETLLSFEPLGEAMTAIFGTGAPLGEWFARLLHGSLVSDAIDAHRDFDELVVDALHRVAARMGTSLPDEAPTRMLAAMRSLPPHPDVPEALERLAASGQRMIALTNGTAETVRAQLTYAGLAGALERMVSIEEAGRYKPHRDAYLHAARVAGVAMPELLLVAAHDWDCAGAIAAGGRAVFVERPGAVWMAPGPVPELRVPDLRALAEALGA